MKNDNGYEAFKQKWQTRWAQADYDLNWRITEIPPEIQNAVSDGWFPPGARLLDIGCGSGEVSAWLANQGFDVLGIDIAAGAIERARVATSHIQPQPTFQVVDICHERPKSRRFDALIDRGCLHTIPESHVPGDVENVAASCMPGATFLLIFKTWNRSGELSVEMYRRRAEQLIESHFQPMFEIMEVAQTVIPRSAGQSPDRSIPGFVIRLRRK